MAERPGRPALDPESPSAAVHLKLPAKVYDDAYRVRKNGESIQDVIRRGLVRLLKDERGGAL